MTAPEKNFATLQARAALAGHQLYRTASADGAVQYFCCRWGLVRSLGDLTDVERFLDVVTGQRA